MRNLKSEVSQRNPYYISKHRTLELVHFCLQYPEWKRICAGNDDSYLPNLNLDKISSKTNEYSDPTSRIALKKLKCYENMKLIEDVSVMADKDLANYILVAVTEDLKYETIKARLDIPCGRDMFYDRRRRFFWLLSQMR